jgi:hypothetical protein
VHLRGLNAACVHGLFPTPFTNEVLENVGGKESYSFTYGFLGTIKLEFQKTKNRDNLSNRMGILHIQCYAIWIK